MDQVVGWAQEGGYAVRLVEPTHGMRLEELWAVMQEADVMLGVHGAALTHWIFLRPTTVFIQVGVGWGWERDGGWGVDHVEARVGCEIFFGISFF